MTPSKRPDPDYLVWLLEHDRGTNRGFSALAAEVRALQATLERVQALLPVMNQNYTQLRGGYADQRACAAVWLNAAELLEAAVRGQP